MKHYAKANSLVVFFKGRLTVLQINGSHPSVQLAGARKKKFREQTRFLQRVRVAGECFYIWTLRRAPAWPGALSFTECNKDYSLLQRKKSKHTKYPWPSSMGQILGTAVSLDTTCTHQEKKGGWLTDPEPISLGVCLFKDKMLPTNSIKSHYT